MFSIYLITYIIYAFSGVITAIISIYLLGGGGLWSLGLMAPYGRACLCTLMVFRPYGT